MLDAQRDRVITAYRIFFHRQLCFKDISINVIALIDVKSDVSFREGRCLSRLPVLHELIVVVFAATVELDAELRDGGRHRTSSGSGRQCYNHSIGRLSRSRTVRRHDWLDVSCGGGRHFK